MPMRVGGGGHRRVEDLEATSRANNGSLLYGDSETEVGLYHRVVALMIAEGFGAARNRALQADPLLLSDEARAVTFPDGTTETISPLARWERILRLRPSPSATVTQRRETVAFRRGLTGKATRGVLQRVLDGIFSPWPVAISTVTAADLTLTGAYWPLGANTAAYPGQVPSGALTWYSEVCDWAFDVTAPAGYDETEKERRMTLAMKAVDDMLPAFARYVGAYV